MAQFVRNVARLKAISRRSRMIPKFGPVELILILVIVTMLFGVGKLPEVFGSVGRGIREFRRNSSDPAEEESHEEAEAVEAAPAAPVAAAPATAATPVATPVAEPAEKQTAS
jgi:sec-independent protein translocase protein TatA